MDLWPASKLEMVIMASCSVFYMQLYMLLMFGTNMDLYIAVKFPFWYRLHYHARQTIPIIVALAVSCALYCTGIAVYSRGDLYSYYPTMFVSSINSAIGATSLYWPLMVIVILTMTAPAIVVFVLCVMSYKELRNHQRERKLLVVEARVPPSAPFPNSESGGGNRLGVSGALLHVQVRKESGGSEAVQLQVIHKYNSPRKHQTVHPNQPIRNGNAHNQQVVRACNNKVAESKKLLLMLFTFIRFAIVYLSNDMFSFFMAAFFSLDYALIAQYSMMLNGAGDAILYNLLIPRYREASIIFEIKLILKCFRFDIRNFPNIHRIVNFGFKFL